MRRFDRRLIDWDGDPNQIPTRGREFISVDTAARWRIADPLLFLKSVRDEAGAQIALNDIIDSVVRDKVSSTELVEIVRSKDWEVDPRDIERAAAPDTEQQQVLQQEVRIGREELTQAILEESRRLVPGYGIESGDVRIKRLNYIPSVQQQVYNRMISERQRVAEQFRAEGEGQSSQILGETQREVAQVMSEAKRQAEVIRGRAEADATRIYNEAYSADPEFYAFYRSLESYEKSLGKEATLILQTSADYLRYLRDTSPNPDLASGRVSATTRPVATTQPTAARSPSGAAHRTAKLMERTEPTHRRATPAGSRRMGATGSLPASAPGSRLRCLQACLPSAAGALTGGPCTASALESASEGTGGTRAPCMPVASQTTGWLLAWHPLARQPEIPYHLSRCLPASRFRRRVPAVFAAPQRRITMRTSGGGAGAASRNSRMRPRGPN